MQRCSTLWITDLPLPALSPGSLHSAVCKGSCATPAGYSARAGAKAANALTFKPDRSLRADQTGDPITYVVLVRGHFTQFPPILTDAKHTCEINQLCFNSADCLCVFHCSNR